MEFLSLRNVVLFLCITATGLIHTHYQLSHIKTTQSLNYKATSAGGVAFAQTIQEVGWGN